MSTLRQAHVDLSRAQFENRLSAHGHDPGEIGRLWSELAEDEGAGTRAPALGPLIALYLGLLLLAAASVSLLVIYWQMLGAGGVLALALVFLAGSLVASEAARRRMLPQPADALEAIALGWVGVATYAVERLAGLWPRGASDIGHVHLGMTIVAASGLLAGAALFALRSDGLVFLPLSVAVGVLAVDAAELVFGNDLTPRERFTFLLPVGLAWIAGGLWLDLTRRRSIATWAHWVGLVTVGVASVVLVPKTVAGFTVIGVLGAVSLFFSALVRHWSFTVIGAVGVLLAVISALGLLGGIAPLVIAVAGIALVFVGVRWSRWRESIRSAVLAHMPPAVRSTVGRLAP